MHPTSEKCTPGRVKCTPPWPRGAFGIKISVISHKGALIMIRSESDSKNNRRHVSFRSRRGEGWGKSWGILSVGSWTESGLIRCSRVPKKVRLDIQISAICPRGIPSWDAARVGLSGYGVYLFCFAARPNLSGVFSLFIWARTYTSFAWSYRRRLVSF